jgi:hypothetical protein
MRTSILSRSVIAVASLALGSAALAATPATAATPSGITRDQVIAAVNNLRNDAITLEQYYTVLEPQLIAIARPSCNIAATDVAYIDGVSPPVQAGQSVDGLLLKVYIQTPVGDDVTTYRQCAIAILASTDPTLTLSGNLSFGGSTSDDSDAPNIVLPPTNSALSGDVFISAPIHTSGNTYIEGASFTASGSATRDIKVTTSKKVTTKKSKAQKKNAKKKYAKSLKSAKKSYAKATKKAGKNKNKKALAKKAYAKKRAAAKAKYKAAIANFKIVKKTTTTTVNKPFSVSAVLDYTSAP